MGFAILGPLAVTAQGRDFTPTAPKVRQVLAFLLLRRNHLVKVSELVDELWSSRPPDSAMTTLQTYVYKLRKEVLDPCALARLYTKPCGYLLDVADADIDLFMFEQLSSQGRLALESGDSVRGAELLSEALSVWRGEALVGVSARRDFVGLRNPARRGQAAGSGDAHRSRHAAWPSPRTRERA